MRRDYPPILIFVVAVAAALTTLSPIIWPVLLTDGLLSAAVAATAAGWGAWPTVWLGFRKRSPAQQFCIATALGFGLLSIMTLVLGITGSLSQPVAWVLVVAGGLWGLSRLYLS